jgi:RHS repeat-associated protein
LGSASVTANADGTWNSEIKYTAFGEVRVSYGLTPTDYRYTGQLEQASINLYWYRSRWFDGELAHFVQADSLIPDPGDPLAWDRYAYSLNNPIRYNDPSGHWVETLFDVAFIAYDINDIHTNGWNWENGLSLAADVAGLVIPVFTGGGLMVRAAAHADEGVKIVAHADEVVKVGDKIVNAAKSLDNSDEIAKIIADLPLQDHHFATVESKKSWTPIFKEIVEKYGLDLDDAWNIRSTPHRGRHPNDYHRWVYKNMKDIVNEIGDYGVKYQDEFVEMFKERVIQPVLERPEMVRKIFWERIK